MRRLLERGLLWAREHPRVTGAVGTGAGLAALYYGGPPAQAAAERVLPVVCRWLALCS
jgi:hypothetical protein